MTESTIAYDRPRPSGTALRAIIIISLGLQYATSPRTVFDFVAKPAAGICDAVLAGKSKYLRVGLLRVGLMNFGDKVTEKPARKRSTATKCQEPKEITNDQDSLLRRLWQRVDLLEEGLSHLLQQEDSSDPGTDPDN